MLAIVSTPTGPEPREVDAPKSGPRDVLVQVRASALNRADLGMLKGGQHGRAGGVGAVLGLEWAGDIVEVGAQVDRWQVGDRVMGSVAPYAQFAVTDQGRVYPVPSGATYEQAACLPVALQTMHDAIVTNGQLQPGQSVLIQGASSGVGLMALQIAKAMGAGLVIGSSTNPERRARLAEYGAELAVDSTDPDWVAQVLAATDGKGVDLIVDQVSGTLIDDNLRATRICGRIVNVGRLVGMTGPFDFDLHALRRITYVGVTFRTRSAAEVAAIVRKAWDDLGPALTDGRLRLPIDQVFPLLSANEAFERMKRNQHFGKIVLAL